MVRHAVETQHSRAFPILEEYGYPAVAAVVPNSLNREGRLSIDQLREMRDAGWNIASHPEHGTGLADMDPEEARGFIESDFEYLDNRGFPDGARHMFVPYHNINQEVDRYRARVSRDLLLFCGQQQQRSADGSDASLAG